MGETAKKEGIFSRIGKSVKATKCEFKKVVWPTKKQLINNTLIVVAALLLCFVVLVAHLFLVSKNIFLQLGHLFLVLFLPYILLFVFFLIAIASSFSPAFLVCMCAQSCSTL